MTEKKLRRTVFVLRFLILRKMHDSLYGEASCAQYACRPVDEQSHKKDHHDKKRTPPIKAEKGKIIFNEETNLSITAAILWHYGRGARRE